MAKPSHRTTADDLERRLAEVAAMLDRAVAVLNDTLKDIKKEDDDDRRSGSRC